VQNTEGLPRMTQKAFTAPKASSVRIAQNVSKLLHRHVA